MGSRSTTLWGLFAAVIMMGMASPLQAAVYTYGDFSSTNVMYKGVKEASGTDPVALYGAPTVSGDALDFNPVSFNSFSTGATGADITDGTLTFDLEAISGWINHLRFEESGDVTLVGFGGVGTFASVTASVFIDILEVDNVAITPVAAAFNVVFTPSAGDFNQAVDGAGGPFYRSIWSGLLNVDLGSILTANNIMAKGGATKIRVNVDNTLATQSQAGTSAFIAKKNFTTFASTAVPEASSWMMLAVAGSALVVAGRVRRSMAA